MISIVLIVGISAAMFVYWFRCACLLILSAQTTRDFASDVALMNNLSCLKIRDRVSQASAAELGSLLRSLDRDYRTVTGLMGHTTQFESEGGALERGMLRVDYRLMRIYYSAVARYSPQHARQALGEMAGIVCHFANVLGESAAGAA